MTEQKPPVDDPTLPVDNPPPPPSDPELEVNFRKSSTTAGKVAKVVAFIAMGVGGIVVLGGIALVALLAVFMLLLKNACGGH